jgi:hypothetical protein
MLKYLDGYTLRARFRQQPLRLAPAIIANVLYIGFAVKQRGVCEAGSRPRPPAHPCVRDVPRQGKAGRAKTEKRKAALRRGRGIGCQDYSTWRSRSPRDCVDLGLPRSPHRRATSVKRVLMFVHIEDNPSLTRDLSQDRQLPPRQRTLPATVRPMPP